MARVSGKSARAKRKVGRVTARQRRKSMKRAQLRTGITGKTIQVRHAVSMRGTSGLMTAPGMDQPQQAQDILKHSSAIRKFKYWIEEKRLRIWFVSKGVYDYYNVPESVVYDLADASSKGRYFHDSIYGYWSGKPGSMTLHPDFKFKRIR